MMPAESRKRMLPHRITFDRFANAMGTGRGVWETTRAACRCGWSATVYNERLVVDFMRIMDSGSKAVQTVTDLEHEVEACHDWPDYTIAIVASAHEAVLGRCATVQRGRVRGKSIVFVTVIDSRLDADRLADIANAMWTIVKPCERMLGMADTCRNTLAKLIFSWRGDFEGAEPDLMRLTFDPATFAKPGPVPNSIALCNGHAVIATIDRDTTERIARCQRMMDTRAGTDELDMLIDKCLPLRQAIAARVVTKDTHVFLVDQRAGVDCEVYETMDFGTLTGQLVTGVPAFHLCSTALTLAMDAPRTYFGDSVLGSVHLREEQHNRTKRREATAIICKVVGQDSVIRKIKEHVWRPEGRLVRNRVGGRA